MTGAFAGLLLVLAGPANPASAQVYVAGYLGSAATRAADVRLTQQSGTNLVFRDVPFMGRSLDSPLYYGYRIGVGVHRRLALEGEFVHLKIYADLDRPIQVEGRLNGSAISARFPMRVLADQFEVTHGLNLVLGNLVFRRPLGDDRNPARARATLTGRGGVGFTIPRPEVIFQGVTSGAYEIGPVASQLAGGAELRVWRGLRLLGEYKYTFTPTRFTVPDGTGRIRVHSSHLVSGIAIYF